VFARRPEFILLLVTRSAEGKLSSDQFYAQALLEDRRFLHEYSPLRDFGIAILYQRLPSLDAAQSAR
jgi:hypothetical protein